MSLIDRFWAKVDIRGDDECWPWLAGTNAKGYGRINEGGRGKSLLAHRVSYIIANESIPDGLMVLHSCDNPPCCNPKHLFTGTNGDNVRDMFAKGRGNRTTQPKGSDHGLSKLTADTVIEIRNWYATGRVTYKQLAAYYGVALSNIASIVNRQTWTHI